MKRPNINPRGPAQNYPDSATPVTRDPKGVDQGHQNSDLDSSKFAQHHTLGPSNNQSSPGNHNHDGSTSKQIDPSVFIDRLNWVSWVPTLANAGTATLATADGWYANLGDLYFVTAYIVIGTAGSGTSTVTMTFPITPYRGAANRRQIYPAALDLSTGGQNGAMAAWSFASGTAGVDRFVMGNGSILQGANLASGAIMEVQGMVRMA